MAAPAPEEAAADVLNDLSFGAQYAQDRLVMHYTSASDAALVPPDLILDAHVGARRYRSPSSFMKATQRRIDGFEADLPPGSQAPPLNSEVFADLVHELVLHRAGALQLELQQLAQQLLLVRCVCVVQPTWDRQDWVALTPVSAVQRLRQQCRH